MKKWVYIIIGIIILIIIGIVIFRAGFGKNSNEDNWIKNSKGIYIKHGNPSQTPDYVKEQQKAVLCAEDLYSKAKKHGLQFDSECIGECEDYSIDIVHVPRTAADDNPENQCESYPDVTPYFIELNKNGEIVKVAE